jgi:hypothetical protein
MEFTQCVKNPINCQLLLLFVFVLSVGFAETAATALISSDAASMDRVAAMNWNFHLLTRVNRFTCADYIWLDTGFARTLWRAGEFWRWPTCESLSILQCQTKNPSQLAKGSHISSTTSRRKVIPITQPLHKLKRLVLSQQTETQTSVRLTTNITKSYIRFQYRPPHSLPPTYQPNNLYQPYWLTPHYWDFSPPTLLHIPEVLVSP